MKSFLYWSGSLYIKLLKLIHKENLDKRYKYMASKTTGKVLEVACGPGYFGNYVKNYMGFDINKNFIKHGKKKGFNLWLGDAKKKSSYKKCDTLILCDAMHHFNPKFHKLILKLCLANTKKRIIICEPFKDYYVKKMPGKLGELWYNFIDGDGNNESKLEYTHNKKDLTIAINNGFGIIKYKKKEIKEIGEDLIVTYTL